MAIESGKLALTGTALLERDDISDRIGSIGCPILSVHGTADQAISIDRAAVLASAAADHRGIVRVDGAAHAPNLTHPDAVDAALVDFLTSI
jgi:pimeloyl-ACP methyl ester carboxylesterase